MQPDVRDNSGMRIVALIFAATVSQAVHAQYQGANWLHIDYTYMDMTYKEPDVMSEKGRLPGVRAELGLSLMPGLAISAGGEYYDGHLNYDGATFGGTPVKQVTNDYVRDLRALVHLMWAPFVLSAGVGDRYWFDDLVISYRRRTQYQYTPIILTYNMGGIYLSAETDLWGKGTNKSHMSDVNPAHSDVSFKLGKGSGLGFEAGMFIPSALGATRVFLRYHKWNVEQSDVQNDGVNNLVEPKNETTTVTAGIGLAF